MSEAHLKNVIEAALLAAGKPLQLAELAQLFEEHARPENADVRKALDALAADYEGRGIEIKETATGFRVQVRKELAPEISRLWPERPPRYSRALLETLALIAYRQPITRAEIEAVRGVAVNPNIIKTLLERNWVRVVGQRDVPGRPELLGTTKEFLDYFGLKSLDELPPLSELKAMGDINLQLDLANAPAAAVAAVASEAAAVEAVGEAGTPEQAAAATSDGGQPESDETGAAETVVGEAAADEAESNEAESESSESEDVESDEAEVDETEAESDSESDDETGERELIRAETEASSVDQSDGYLSDDDEDDEDPEQGSKEMVAARRDHED